MAPRVNRVSVRPPYRQVADHLRRMIARDELEAGMKLPSVRELAAEWQVDRLTVTRAVGVLESEGLVSAEPGRGVFVRIQRQRRRLCRDRVVHRDERGYYFDSTAQPWVAVAPTSISYGRAPADVAELLQQPVDAEVLIRARQIGEAGGAPLQLATSYLPASLTRGTPLEQADTGPGGIYDRLEETGHQLTWAETVTARMPSPDEAEQLQIPPGVPLLRVLRTTFNQHDEPLEVNDTRWPADRFEITYPLFRGQPRM